MKMARHQLVLITFINYKKNRFDLYRMTELGKFISVVSYIARALKGLKYDSVMIRIMMLMTMMMTIII